VRLVRRFGSGEGKAELAARILSADHGVEAKFGTEDISALFAPLAS